MVDNDFWFLGTQWPPFTGGSMDIAEPIDVSVAPRIVLYSHLAAFGLTSSLSSASSGCQVVRLLRLSSGTPLVTTLAGSTVTMRKVTTSSRLTTTTDGTFSPHGVKWNRCPVHDDCHVACDTKGWSGM